jgi:hypothetical protein
LITDARIENVRYQFAEIGGEALDAPTVRREIQNAQAIVYVIDQMGLNYKLSETRELLATTAPLACAINVPIVVIRNKARAATARRVSIDGIASQYFEDARTLVMSIGSINRHLFGCLTWILDEMENFLV